MENDLKFTGKFTNLKKMGYKLLKLYARNYKVYNKDLPKSFKIWVWVANGGYIEINDLYGNTKNFITAIKTINWDSVEERIGFTSGEPYKRMFVRLNHSDPTKGYLITDTSIELEVIMSLPKNVRQDITKHFDLYDEAYAKVIANFDREIVVFENSCKILLTELDKINLVD